MQTYTYTMKYTNTHTHTLGCTNVYWHLDLATGGGEREEEREKALTDYNDMRETWERDEEWKQKLIVVNLCNHII